MPADQPSPRRPLKLRAADEDDLAIIGACLQDAIVMVGDMGYFPQEQRFAFVANRFLWEVAVKPGCELARSCVAVVIEQVQGAERRGLDLSKRQTLHSLLSVTWGEAGLHLWFSGGGEVLLKVESINVRMEDFGECWPAAWRPDHKFDGS